MYPSHHGAWRGRSVATVRPPRERRLTGLQYLEAVTTLLQTARAWHPTAGLYEAADLQWWWRMARPTDAVEQLFWFDHLGQPEAAVVLTQWPDRVALDPLVMPDVPTDWLEHVVRKGLAHARALGYTDLSLEIDSDDIARQEIFAGHGFTRVDEGVVEAWIAADARPTISPLAAGYRLADRGDTPTTPHHMVGRNGPDVEQRLRQTSLYRPDLDLMVLDGHDRPAAYGLCWYDPTTATGLVEPMRTEDAQQRRGLARHVLAAGLDRLAQAGAQRIKICFEQDNPAARDLYLGVGFQQVARTDMWASRDAREPSQET